MKYVVNDCFGGFGLSEFAMEKLGVDKYDLCSDRENKALIELIETYGSKKCSSDCAHLIIVEIPDEATDYRLIEYDGAEYVLYVEDGKMHCAQHIEEDD